jgi:cob(I)alamin adenosyltransferase
MVHLSRIYTKFGDGGETCLGNGKKVAKDHIRVEAYGSVDELNALLGMILSAADAGESRDLLLAIQNDLFDLGGDLCIPQEPGQEPGSCLRVTDRQVDRLEKAIDRLNERLKPLNSFILPGGSPMASWCHLARTVCRRAERQVVTLAKGEQVNAQVIIYLNRLSDLLFVMARIHNDEGSKDILWKPGANG